MKEYGADYNKIFDLYSALLNIDSHYARSLGSEVKQWLISEREKKGNVVQTNELATLLEKVIEFEKRFKQARDYVELCSFNLHGGDVPNHIHSLGTLSNINISSVIDISEELQHIEATVDQVKNHMRDTYTPRPFSEALKEFSETYGKEILDGKGIYVPMNEINELRYIAPEDGAIQQVLNRLTHNTRGLVGTHKEWTENGKDDYLRKHHACRDGITSDLRELERLSKKWERSKRYRSLFSLFLNWRS